MKQRKINTARNRWPVYALLALLWMTAGETSRASAAGDGLQPAHQASIVFAVIGDYGSSGQPEADVAALVKSWNPDFIVTVGDNNYPIGAAYSIDQNIGQYYHDYIYPYKGTYGAGAAYKRFFPVLGNHDWMSNGAKPYFDYFNFFNQKGYYDFVNGPLHFFMLDSDPNEPDGTTSTSKQARWLHTNMSASTSPFNIVVMHHPPYSSGQHGSTPDMQWPFKDWGASAVFSGHDHLYERLSENGLTYFVDGIGGESIYSFTTVVPGSQLRFNADYGAMRVQATDSSIRFQAYARTGALIDDYTIGNSVPQVAAITRSDPSPSSASTVRFAVNFSAPVTGVDASDFVVTTAGVSGAPVKNVTGSGSAYLVEVATGSGDGTLRLDLVDDDSIIDSNSSPLGGAGTGNGNYSVGDSYSIDKTPPVVTSITRASPSPTNSLSVDFSIKFSEPVSGVDATDFVINSLAGGATITNVSGAGDAYDVSVLAASDDTISISLIDNDSITDAAGNPLAGAGVANGNFAGGDSYVIDRTPPRVTSIQRAGPGSSSAASVDFIVTFSESVSGVDAADFAPFTDTLNNPAITSVVDHDPFYIVTVYAGGGSGSLRLDLHDDDSITDSAGNPLGGAGASNGDFTAGDSYTIARTAPRVTSIIRASPNPTGAATVDFIVTFSESVSGVEASDFRLNMENLLNAAITNVQNLDPFYLVTVSTGIGTGNLRLDLVDNDGITSATGDFLGGIGLGNGDFSAGEVFSVAKDSVNFAAPALRGSRRDQLTNNSSPTLAWMSVRGAGGYEIAIASDAGFAQIIRDAPSNATSLALIPALPDGTYYWRVRAYNSSQQPGKYGAVQTITIDTAAPQPPTLIAPSDASVISTRPTFVWRGAADASVYLLQVDDNADFSSPEISAARSDTSYRSWRLSRGTHYWRVAARDAAGNWSAWSGAWSIRVP